jgi:hypothetical protein
VRLTPEGLRSDEALGDAIAAIITGTPRLARFTRVTLRRDRALRKVLNDEQWRVYMLLEEAVADRVLAETSLLVGWAFKEGRRYQRGSR